MNGGGRSRSRTKSQRDCSRYGSDRPQKHSETHTQGSRGQSRAGRLRSSSLPLPPLHLNK